MENASPLLEFELGNDRARKWKTLLDKIDKEQHTVGGNVMRAYTHMSSLMLCYASKWPNQLAFERRKETFSGKMSKLAADGFFESKKDSVSTCSCKDVHNELYTSTAKCFYCGMEVTLSSSTSESSIKHSHQIKSPKCFMCKLKQSLKNKTENLQAMIKEDIQKASKAWRILKQILCNQVLTDLTSSFGFHMRVVRAGIARYFILNNGKMPKSGDVIAMIYSDLEPLVEYMQDESMKDVLDPLSMIEAFEHEIQTIGTGSSSTSSDEPSLSVTSDTTLQVRQRCQEGTVERGYSSAPAATSSHCLHDSQSKEANSKAMMLAPCQDLIRCPTCIAGDDINMKFCCPRCGSDVTSYLPVYIT